MEVKVKNSELSFLIYQLCGYNLEVMEQQEGYGLEGEEITLGTKNRIQKLLGLLKGLHTPFKTLLVELIQKHGGQEKDGNYRVPEITPEYSAEYTELAETEHTISLDPIDFNKLADVCTKNSYDFRTLSRFFENY